MTDELRERVVRELHPSGLALMLPGQREFTLDRIDRAIAICREHYEAEIAQLEAICAELWKEVHSWADRWEKEEIAGRHKDAEIARLMRELHDRKAM